jgi:hypothetical protein
MLLCDQNCVRRVAAFSHIVRLPAIRVTAAAVAAAAAAIAQHSCYYNCIAATTAAAAAAAVSVAQCNLTALNSPHSSSQQC